MRAVLFLALKDLRLLVRDRAAAFFAFVFPLLLAVFFGYVFSGTTSEPLHVAGFAEAASPAAEALLGALGEDGAFVLERVPDRADGEALVRRGKAAALVVVPADYAAGLDDLFSGGGARISLVVDPSRRAEGAMLVGKVHEVAFRTVFASMSDPAQFGRVLDRVEKRLESADLPLGDRIAIRTAISRARAMSTAERPAKDAAGAAGAPDAKRGMAAWKPVSVEVAELPMRPGVPANGFALSFMQGIAWALFGAVAAFGAGFAEERERGTLVRLLVSPLGLGQVLAGKALACFLACVATEGLLLAVAVTFFGVAVASWGFLAAAVACSGICFAGLMMLLSAAFRTPGAAQGAGRALMLVLAMVGGGTVPLAFMPPVLRMASDLSPFKWAVVAAEGATWRAYGPAEMALPCAVLAAIGVAGLATGAALLRRRA